MSSFYWKASKAELDAIAGLADGDKGIVFDATNNISFWHHNGTSWVLGDLLSQGYCGLQWNESTDAYTRLGSTKDVAIGTKPSDSLVPIQASMKGCLLDDLGNVKYYLGDSDWSVKANGEASDLTGTDGQVMVEIPMFYYRYSYASNVHTWEISLYLKPGFSLHPAFIKGGVVKSARYVGAYEGVLYDTSQSRYAGCVRLEAHSCTFDSAGKTITSALTNAFTLLKAGDKLTVTDTTSNNATFTIAAGGTGDAAVTVEEAVTDEVAAATVIETPKDFTATTGDKLSSVKGFSALNYATRANFRTMATNRGAGWQQLDFSLASAIQLLYLIEYGSFYSQNYLGAGITNISDWTAYNNYNPIAPGGNGDGIGNTSGNTAGSTSAATESAKYLKYRGIENIYGHLWKWVDGFNINNNVPYVCYNPSNFADDTATNYQAHGVTLANADGYQSTLAAIRDGFLPLTVGASSSTKLTDYYYQSTGWQPARLGGGSDAGATAGLFAWLLRGASSFRSRATGGQLCY